MMGVWRTTDGTVIHVSSQPFVRSKVIDLEPIELPERHLQIRDRLICELVQR
jgi:hypothetical protein